MIIDTGRTVCFEGVEAEISESSCFLTFTALERWGFRFVNRDTGVALA